MLLDCGWTTKFDVEDLSELKDIASTIDFILLTHAEVKQYRRSSVRAASF